MAERTDGNTGAPLLSFSHESHAGLRDCYLQFEFALKGLLICASGLSGVFTVALLSSSGIFDNNKFILSMMGVLWLSICLMIGLIVQSIFMYFETKLEHMSERLERLMSDLPRQIVRPSTDTVTHKNVVHLSVKSSRATHSSETRTPSALDMSPIASESTFHNLTDNFQSDLQPLSLKVDAQTEAREGETQTESADREEDKNLIEFSADPEKKHFTSEPVDTHQEDDKPNMEATTAESKDLCTAENMGVESCEHHTTDAVSSHHDEPQCVEADIDNFAVSADDATESICADADC